MKMRTFVLASVAVFLMSGAGAFTTTRYLTKSPGPKASAVAIADQGAAGGDRHWPQVDAARALKTSGLR